MERSHKLLVMVVTVLALALACSNAQTICNIPVSGLMQCRPAVTPPRPPAPTNACCSALSKGNLPCLCGYKNSTVLPSLGIDPKLAVQLPGKCRLPQPPNC